MSSARGLSASVAMSILDRLQQNPKVLIKNPAEVQRKIRQIILDGYNKLLVISDFDYTLSRYRDDKNEKCLTTHAIFDVCTAQKSPALAKKLQDLAKKYRDDKNEKCLTTHAIFDVCTAQKSPALAKKLQDLAKKYLPIEFDPHMSMEEKTPYMDDWWRISHKYIVEEKFTLEDIEGFVAKAKILLRDAAVEFVRSVEAHNVPLILFSAGIGNIIEIILKRNLGHVPATLHLISNMMGFDENNVCASFSEPLIHTFCKNSSVITGERPFFHHVRNRSNVILLGDSLGDVAMDVGIESEGTALKIGYLNFNFEQLMEKYLEVYDIVLVDNQSMEVPLEIFRFCGFVHSQSETHLNDYFNADVITEKTQTTDDELVSSPAANVIA
uniref:5'-nucleotidase n=1 Tax=Panagrolaimus sp. JU765 TaxID=591449 RepID=A0AC34QWE9_9BILA